MAWKRPAQASFSYAAHVTSAFVLCAFASGCGSNSSASGGSGAVSGAAATSGQSSGFSGSPAGGSSGNQASSGTPGGASGTSGGASGTTGGASGGSSGDSTGQGTAGTAGTGGDSGVSTGGAQSGAAGAGGASATADGGAAGLGDAGLGGASKCASHAYAVCEDFEATAVGGTPTGWTIPSSNYGTATLGVASDFAARGTHSWKVSVNTKASTEKYLQRGNLGALANSHYGRLFFRIQSPTDTMFIHWDLILGAGQVPGGGTTRIRWGSTGSNGGLPNSGWHWIYNIEQGDRGIEDNGPGHPAIGVDQWMCVEWLWDGTNQAADFYFNGVERPALKISKTLSNGAVDIPIFTSLNFGIAEYQGTNNTPLVFWIDEIALDTARIGCGG